MKYTLFAAALAAAAMTMPAAAAPIGAMTGNSAVVDFEGYDAFVTSGPETVAPGVTFGASTDSTLGAFIAELEMNGTWGAGKLFAALGEFGADPVPGSMVFSFDTPVAQAGAFVNALFPFSGMPPAPITIEALDVMGDVLESYLVPVSTPDGFNDGTFAGIGRATKDIKAFRISGFGLVVDDVTYSVPAPAAASLLLAGLLGASALRRRSAR